MSKSNRRTKFWKNGPSQGGSPPLQTLTTTKKDDNSGFIANDGVLAVKLLPPELLELILRTLRVQRILLESCWNTCSAWNNALRSTDFYFKMILWLILPYLSRRDLIVCSSVSKTWNATIDACIQDAEDFGSNRNLSPMQRIVKFCHPFKICKLTEWISRFRLSGDNQVEDKIPVGNSVSFQRFSITFWPQEYFEREGNDGPFCADRRNLLKYLDHFGYLIRHLSLGIVDNENVNCLYKLKMIRSCLKRTPNLRVLHISIMENMSSGANDVELEPFNSNNWWPTLEHLKVLKLGDFVFLKEYASIANAYASQLLYLKVGYECMKAIVPHAARFSALQKIVFNISWITVEMELEFAKFVRSSKCQLKHMTLIIPDEPHVKNIRYLTMAVNAASATLETLIFRPQDNNLTWGNFDINKFKLRLPKLKVLEMTIFSYPSIQTLRGCPALQKLTVTTLYNRVVSHYETNWESSKNTDRIYRDLYSKHQFWSQLADIQSVIVELDLHEADEGVIGNGVPIKKERKVYTRCGYDEKWANDHAKGMRIDCYQVKCQESEYEDASRVLKTRSKKYRRV